MAVAPPPPILTKADMYPLYEAGMFGNKLRTWPSVDALLASDYKGTVSLRYAAAAGGGGWAKYEVPVDAVDAVVADWVAEGASRLLVKVNESAPDSRLAIQGEVARSPYWNGLVFTHSTWKGKMRDAMKWAEVAWGLQAKMLLERYLSPSSMADIEALMEVYPEHVVEFSAYEMCLGTIPGRNAVIWEVRSY